MRLIHARLTNTRRGGFFLNIEAMARDAVLGLWRKGMGYGVFLSSGDE